MRARTTGDGKSSHRGRLEPGHEEVIALPFDNVLNTGRVQEGELLENDGAMAAFDVVPATAVRNLR